MNRNGSPSESLSTAVSSNVHGSSLSVAEDVMIRTPAESVELESRPSSDSALHPSSEAAANNAIRTCGNRTVRDLRLMDIECSIEVIHQ